MKDMEISRQVSMRIKKLCQILFEKEGYPFSRAINNIPQDFVWIVICFIVEILSRLS